jgi:hypothetical protein
MPLFERFELVFCVDRHSNALRKKGIFPNSPSIPCPVADVNRHEQTVAASG